MKSITKSKSVTNNNKNKTVKNKTTKSVKSALKKADLKKADLKKADLKKVGPPKKAKVAMPPKTKIKITSAIIAVDEEFNQFLTDQTKNQTKQVVSVAAPRRKEKFVDPGILFKLEASRGILRKPNGDDDYSLPTVKQFNKAVAENRLNGSPIAEKE